MFTTSRRHCDESSRAPKTQGWHLTSSLQVQDGLYLWHVPILVLFPSSSSFFFCLWTRRWYFSADCTVLCFAALLLASRPVRVESEDSKLRWTCDPQHKLSVTVVVKEQSAIFNVDSCISVRRHLPLLYVLCCLVWLCMRNCMCRRVPLLCCSHLHPLLYPHASTTSFFLSSFPSSFLSPCSCSCSCHCCCCVRWCVQFADLAAEVSKHMGVTLSPAAHAFKFAQTADVYPLDCSTALWEVEAIAIALNNIPLNAAGADGTPLTLRIVDKE